MKRNRYRRLAAFAIGVLCLASPATGQIVSFNLQNEVRIGGNPSAIAAGDFNGDGRLDLAVTNFGGDSVTVLKGAGNGGFSTEATLKAGNLPFGIAAAP